MIILILSSILALIFPMLASVYSNVTGALVFSMGSDGFAQYLPSISLLENLMVRIAWVIVTINVIAAGVHVLTATMTGNEAESPMKVIGRCILVAVLLALMTPIRDAFMSFLQDLVVGIREMYDAETAKTALENLGNMENWDVWGGAFGAFLFSLLLTYELLMALLTYVERYVMMAFYMYSYPICIASFTSSEYSDVGKSWFKGLVSQMAAFLLATWMFCQFEICMKHIIDGNGILNYLVCVALLACVKETERILSIFGLRTMPTGATARAAGIGLLAMARGLGQTTKLAYNGIKNFRANKLADRTPAGSQPFADVASGNVAGVGLPGVGATAEEIAQFGGVSSINDQYKPAGTRGELFEDTIPQAADGDLRDRQMQDMRIENTLSNRRNFTDGQNKAIENITGSVRTVNASMRQARLIGKGNYFPAQDASNAFNLSGYAPNLQLSGHAVALNKVNTGILVRGKYDKPDGTYQDFTGYITDSYFRPGAQIPKTGMVISNSGSISLGPCYTLYRTQPYQPKPKAEKSSSVEQPKQPEVSSKLDQAEKGMKQ